MDPARLDLTFVIQWSGENQDDPTPYKWVLMDEDTDNAVADGIRGFASKEECRAEVEALMRDIPTAGVFVSKHH